MQERKKERKKKNGFVNNKHPYIGPTEHQSVPNLADVGSPNKNKRNGTENIPTTKKKKKRPSICVPGGEGRGVVSHTHDNAIHTRLFLVMATKWLNTI
jgi:hypothetical protein